MKKKIKLSKALVLDSELQTLMVEKGLPMKTRFKARKTFKSIREDIESYYEHRSELVKELGTETGKTDPRGNMMYDFTDDNRKKFGKQNKEVLDSEIEINVVISLKDLEQLSDETENFYGNLIDLLL